MGNKIKIWIQAVRAPFFTAVGVPVLLGSVVAWEHMGRFHWDLFLMALVGAVFLQAGANLANDYFDHKSGADEANIEFIRPFTGGSRMIQNRVLTPGEVRFAALLSFALGGLIGLYLAWVRGWTIMAIGAGGVFAGYFYTAPPLRLVARGVGELFIGLSFGPICLLGAYYVQAQRLSLEAALASVPVGLLIAAVLYINEFTDYRADREVGKNHLVVRLGRKRAVTGYALLMGCAYLSIIAGVLFSVLSPYTFLVLLAVPISVKAIKTCATYYDDPVKLVPANAGTILSHLAIGILLTIGYVIDKVV